MFSMDGHEKLSTILVFSQYNKYNRYNTVINVFGVTWIFKSNAESKYLF